MGKDKPLEKQIETYNNQLQYDIQAKKLLGLKSVFAQIIRLCVPEFEGMTLEDVKNYILDIQVLAKEVSEGYGDVFSQKEEEKILLLSNESKVEGEKTVVFDIKTIVRNPKYKEGDTISYETMELVMNAEMQVDSKNLGYKIEQRGVYYVARLTSEQLGTLTKKTNYSKLNKVYSIWILLGEEEDKLTHLQLKDQDNSIILEADLFHILLIRLSKTKYVGEKNNIFHLLHSFFDIMELELRKTELNCYFDFRKEEDVEEGVSHVSSLASFMIEQAETIAESRGIVIGESRGEARGILISAKKLLERGYSFKEIEDVLGITKKELIEYIEEQKEERSI